ncbi:platelet glycoprotein VI-like [Monodelphis domestica]|uniref:platelet glycoprotein VI-like n=1 Tax=Monodelphis domestica TaxID=13616 RepID=UPI0024E1E980|nr:platelet glycoprotein VI-like [Monodelphis domestica]
MAGIYEKPTLLALPSPLVGTGEDVTLQCQAESRFDRLALYKEGEANTSISHEWRSQPNFPIPAVTTVHGGTYRCYSFDSDSPYLWSVPSDPLKLIVTGKEASTSPFSFFFPLDKFFQESSQNLSPLLSEDKSLLAPEEPDDANSALSSTLSSSGASSSHPKLWERILIGVSVFLIILFLFFLLLCHHQCHASFSEFLGTMVGERPRLDGGMAQPLWSLTPALLVEPEGRGRR